MKKHWIFGGLSAGCFSALAVVSSGCMTMRDHLLTPHTVTNTISLPAVTNTVFVTNAVVTTQLVTNSIAQRLEPAYLTNWVVATNIAILPAQTQTVVLTNAWEPSRAALDTAQGIGAAANLAAPGSGSVVAWGLSGLLSLFAAYQTRKAGNHQAAAETLGKAIEQARVALQSSGPSGQAIATSLTDVIEGHAEAAGAGVAAIIQEVASRVGGDTASAVALHAASSVLHRAATAEELMVAAQNGLMPDWFSAAERAAVAKIKA